MGFKLVLWGTNLHPNISLRHYLNKQTKKRTIHKTFNFYLLLPQHVTGSKAGSYKGGRIASTPQHKEPNSMQMLQNWSKGNINCEIELYSSKALTNLGFIMARALIALENLTEN